jgi:hypothetical protein
LAFLLPFQGVEEVQVPELGLELDQDQDQDQAPDQAPELELGQGQAPEQECEQERTLFSLPALAGKLNGAEK